MSAEGKDTHLKEKEEPRKEKKQRKVWSSDEVHALLSLIKGTGDKDGFFAMIKSKKITRAAAMAAIARQMRLQGYDVTPENADNKWKSLTNEFRLTEDHNAKSGNDWKVPKDETIHDEMAELFGESASRRPLATSGSSSILSTSSSSGIPPSPSPSTPPPSCGSRSASRRVHAYSPSLGGDDGDSGDELEDELFGSGADGEDPQTPVTRAAVSPSSMRRTQLSGKRSRGDLRDHDLSDRELHDDDLDEERTAASALGPSSSSLGYGKKKRRRSDAGRSRATEVMKWASSHTESGGGERAPCCSKGHAHGEDAVLCTAD